MCFICSQNPNADPVASYDQHSSGYSATGFGSGSSAPYTWDQIANYLTSGYWAFNGGLPRSFTLDQTRVITVDLSRLSAQTQTIATEALANWSSVTGINFVNIGTAGTVVNEGGDFGNNIISANTIGTNSTVNGSINVDGDADVLRVNFVAGQTYVIGMGRGATGTLDAQLVLYDANGIQVAFSDNDQYADAGEYITFTASTSGSYYISAQAFGASTGAYELSVQTAAQMTFGDLDPTGAYAFSDITGSAIQRSYINISDTWSPLNLNGYMLQTYMHEIGHALGLGHSGPYNGSATWPANALYDNDSWSASIMSYFDQTDNPNDPAAFAYLATIMPADIIAIQNLYGAGTTGFETGNTIWGVGGNVTGRLQTLFNMAAGITPSDGFNFAGNPFAFTIYDTNGLDTLTGSFSSANQTINLNELSYSSIGSGTGNVVIARGTIIENAIGGNGNDTIIGNAANNTISGRGGTDTLSGGAGADTIYGGTGVSDATDLADTINGDAGNDILHGNGGDDTIYGGADSDTVYGGGGGDTIYGGTSISDTANEIDELRGESGNDTIYGNGGDDFIYGGFGLDNIFGGAGNDTIFGGNLLADATDSADTIDGGAGNDTISGNGGIDIIYGGADRDTIRGGADNDVIYGGSSATDATDIADELRGESGNDTIYGAGGGDTIIGGIGNDTLYGGIGNDILTGSADADQFVFNTALNATTNADIITDFLVNVDDIVLSQAIFAGIIGSFDNEFQIGTAANDVNDRIIYNQATGQLFYDSNGSTGGSANQILFATVTAGTALTINDFMMVA
jgi:RTX calcium-binding nonapeptide repeat (4 copies)